MHFAIQPRLAGYVDDFHGLVRQPQARLRRLAAARHIGDALLVVVTLITLELLASLLAAIPPMAAPPVPHLWFVPDWLTHDVSATLQAAYGPANRYRMFFPPATAAAALGAWFAGAALVHFVAHLLGGRGPYARYLTLTGYLQGLSLLVVPFSLLHAFLTLAGAPAAGGSVAILALMLAAGVVTWRVVLEIWAAGTVYRLSSGRATIAVLTPYTLAVLVPLAGLVAAVTAYLRVAVGG